MKQPCLARNERHESSTASERQLRPVITMKVLWIDLLSGTSLSSFSLSRDAFLTASSLALGLGLAGSPLAAWAACAPGATQACSAPGGSGVPNRSGSGGAGNGEGGGSSQFDPGTGATIVIPGGPESGGNGGTGAPGSFAGGAGGNTGVDLVASGVFIGSSVSGGDGAVGADDLNFASGAGGGGTGIYFRGGDLTIGTGVSVSGGTGGNGGSGTSFVGNGGGGGGGGTGLISSTSAQNITNWGVIQGGDGGVGGDGGFAGGGGGGGDGFLALDGSTIITNLGTITGGVGGNAGLGSNASGLPGSSGAGINLIRGFNIIVNDGTISGGAGIYGAAGAGIITNGNDIIANAGTISGGLNSDGITRASAIRFNGFGNMLQLLRGSTMVGDLTLSSGAEATIAPESTGLALNNDIVLSNSSTVTFNTSTASLRAIGGISGSGQVIKKGVGSLTLSGASTFTGGTTLMNGTLRLEHNQALGTGALTTFGSVVDYADRLTLANPIILGSSGTQLQVLNGTATQAGVISEIGGPRPLEKIGNGTLILTGANTYTGDTTVSGGTLVAAASEALGSGNITVDNAAALRFQGASVGAGNRAIDLLNSGSLYFEGGASAGSATITNRTTGSIYLSGSATASKATIVNEGGGRVDVSGVTAGTSIGSLSGAGGVFLGSRRLTLGTLGKDDTLGGVINGTGSLLKAGAGTLTLSGNSSGFSGSTRVTAGALVVNGSLARSVVTVGNGLLGGSGTIGGLSVLSGGRVAPGNSIGKLNVAGDVAFASGSIYRVEVNAAGQADRIAATGAAVLAGGRVQVQAETGSYQPSTRYTILTANGGVSGAFAGVSSNFAYLDPALTYDAKAVGLILSRKADPTDPDQPIAFHSVAETRNQYNAADAVETLGSDNRLFQAVVGQSVSGARQAFDALSGEAHASAAAVAYEDGRLVREAVLTRLRQPLVGSAVPLLAQGSYRSAYAADLPGASRQTVAVPMRVAPRQAMWGEGFGSWGRIASNGNAARLDTSTGGFILGADTQIDAAFRVGLAGAFTSTSFDLDRRLSSGFTDSYFAALYGSGTWGAVNVRFGASYAWHDFDVSRTIRFPGFSDNAHASYDGWSAQAFAEVGYRVDLGVVQLEPFVGASLLRLKTDSFSEEAGAAALTGYEQDQDLATTTLGLRAEARLSAELPLSVRGLVGWRHAFGDLEPSTQLAFAGGASAFTIAGVPVDRDALVAEAGLVWTASDAINLGVSYSGQIGQREQEHALKGSFIWRFGTR